MKIVHLAVELVARALHAADCACPDWVAPHAAGDYHEPAVIAVAALRDAGRLLPDDADRASEAQRLLQRPDLIGVHTADGRLYRPSDITFVFDLPDTEG